MLDTVSNYQDGSNESNDVMAFHRYGIPPDEKGGYREFVGWHDVVEWVDVIVDEENGYDDYGHDYGAHALNFNIDVIFNDEDDEDGYDYDPDHDYNYDEYVDADEKPAI